MRAARGSGCWRGRKSTLRRRLRALPLGGSSARRCRPAPRRTAPPVRAALGRWRVDYYQVPCAHAAAQAARALFVGERLDHPVGDVDARTGINDRLLDDQVKFLVGSDLLNDLVRTLLHCSQLFVLAQIEVFAKLPLHSLQIAAHVGEIALL